MAWGSSSGKSRYGNTPRTAKKGKRSNPAGSLLHTIAHNPISTLVGNLGSDVKDMAYGLPTGLVDLATDPVDSLRLMGESTWHTWSPLFSEDYEKFAEGVYDHPLAPILDVLSVLTLGSGAIVKGAKVVGETGTAGRLARAGLPRQRALRNPIEGGKGAVEHYKNYSGNPFRRAVQIQQEKAVNGLASLLPSMFAVGKDINTAFIDGAGRSTLRGAERADAWRWYTRDLYDRASRAHAVQAAANVWVGGVIAQAKRLNEDPAYAVMRVAPHMTQQIADHAHLAAPQDLLRPSGKALSKRLKAERAAMKAEGVPKGSGQWNARLAAVRGTGTSLRDDYLFVHKDALDRVENFVAAYEDSHGWTPETFHDYLKGTGSFAKYNKYGSHVTTSKVEEAATDANGNYLVARDHHKFTEEAANSVNFLNTVWKKSTLMWKWAVLAARPAYLVNNAVGNMFMYMVSTGPHGFRGLVDGFRQITDPAGIQRGISLTERRMFAQSRDWQDQYFLGLHRGYSRDIQEHLGVERLPIGSRKAKFLRLAGGGLYEITHKVSDTFLRRAAINTIMRSRPEVQALMRQGHHFDDAARAASENRALREAVQERVNDILGQYHYLNPAERAVRAIVPFYTWDRAIARHGAHLFLDRPTTAAFLQQVGDQGVETTEQLLGELPEFLKSALPLSLVGIQPDPDTGRLPILGTTGLNPYASLASLIDTGSALVTGGSPIGPALAGQVHPFITGGIEATTGTSLLTGARMPADEGGLLPRILADTALGLPETQTIQAGVAGPQGGDETLFEKDLSQYLSAFMGIPVKYLNQQVAAEMARRENKTPVRRKRRKKHRQGW